MGICSHTWTPVTDLDNITNWDEIKTFYKQIVNKKYIKLKLKRNVKDPKKNSFI